MNAPTRPPSPPRPPDEELLAPATQVVRDRDAYLGVGRDIGRRLTEDQFELFVVGDAAEALQRELQRLSPRYIALHDVGTSTSLKLLQAMAATTESKILRLSIRRQGHGVALATLQFVEVVASDGATIRAYSTDIDADTHSRHEMARVLLAQSTLGVVVFGDLPSHALKPAFQPLLDALGTGHGSGPGSAGPEHSPSGGPASRAVGGARWRTRELLLLPIGAPALLSPFAAAFISAGLHARVAPQAPRASEAWQQIGAAWHRLHHGVAEAQAAAHAPAPLVPPAPPAAASGLTARFAPALDDTSEMPTEPMGLRDHGGKAPPAPPGIWLDYVTRCASIKGMVSCCVYDRTGGRVLAHAGGRPPAELLHELGERLLIGSSEVGAMLGTGADVSEILLSFTGHHVLLRALPKHRGIVLHAVLDAAHSNLQIARAQLQRFDPPAA